MEFPENYGCNVQDPTEIIAGNNMCHCECYNVAANSGCPPQHQTNSQAHPECYRWSHNPCTTAGQPWVCNAEGHCYWNMDGGIHEYTCWELCEAAGCVGMGMGSNTPETWVYNNHWQCGLCSGSCADYDCVTAPYDPGSCGWELDGC